MKLRFTMVSMSFVLAHGSVAGAQTEPVVASEPSTATPPEPTPPVTSVPAVTISAPAAPAPDLAPVLSRTPIAGRIMLQFESTGAPLALGEAGSGGTDAMADLPGAQANHTGFCNTPCTLYVRPGLLSLGYSGRGLRNGSLNMDAGRDTRVRLRAASEGAWVGGIVLMAAGSTVFTVGAMASWMSGILRLRPSWAGPPPTTGDDVIFYGGFVAMGVGAIAMIVSLPMILGNQTGVAGQLPIDRAQARLRTQRPRWNFSGTPVPGGAMLAGALVF